MVDSRAPVAKPTERAISDLSAFLLRENIRNVVVACSGGADSVALVLGARELRDDLHLSIAVGHVNHRLRGKESDGDAAFVKGLARRLALPYREFRRPVSDGGNLEEKARDARYAALCAWAKTRSAAVLTAHTEDDQAETVLMNLLRGCGPDGLAGMGARRMHEGTLIGRPFLGTARKDLLVFLRRRGQNFRTDSTNASDRFLRNYLRNGVFKKMEARSPGFRHRVARLADLVRDEQTAWELWLSRLEDSALSDYRGGRLLDHRKFRRAPVGLQRRLLRRVAGRDLLTFDGVERLRTWMAAPPTGGRLWQLRKGWTVERLSRTGGSPTASLFWFRQTPKEKRTLING